MNFCLWLVCGEHDFIQCDRPVYKCNECKEHYELQLGILCGEIEWNKNDETSNIVSR